VSPLNEGWDVVDGAYVTITTPATLFEIVLDQWIHPYKTKLYSFDIALYIKLLTRRDDENAVPILWVRRYPGISHVFRPMLRFLESHIINSFEIKITSLETLNICSQTSD
jgi:hypothetical protein